MRYTNQVIWKCARTCMWSLVCHVHKYSLSFISACSCEPCHLEKGEKPQPLNRLTHTVFIATVHCCVFSTIDATQLLLQKSNVVYFLNKSVYVCVQECCKKTIPRAEQLNLMLTCRGVSYFVK